MIMETLKGFSSSEFRQLKKQINKRLLEGIEKGFFELRITGEKSKRGKKRVQIQFSPIEQFTISENENNV